MSRSKSGGDLRRSHSAGALNGSQASLSASCSPARGGDSGEVPKLPMHLSTKGLTRRRKLASSTLNLHGYMAEDYTQLSWPLPKMFGMEKYAHTLIDIEDKRYLKSCSEMSQRLIRLHYDQQIVDLEWRKTYKELLDAEKHLDTLGAPMPVNGGDALTEKTKALLQKRIDNAKKYLLELQEQKAHYETEIQEVYDKCAAIKASIKKENDLEAIRSDMTKQTRDRIGADPSKGATFKTRSEQHTRVGLTGNMMDFSGL